MCGIAGYLAKENHFEELKEAVKSLIHRGPDDEGFFNFENLNLGFRRLSIIDLEAGKQPMKYKNSVIIFNGEIYNFLELKEKMLKDGIQFETRSDTEVLLKHIHFYGYEKTLEEINGMFAFAYYNTSKKELFLARDRAGKKPLYYYYDGSRFAFASEVKALLKLRFVNKNIDFKALLNYLFYGYVPSPMSIYEKIYKLEPATYMIVDNNLKIKKAKYWKIEASEEFTNEEEFIEVLRNRLYKAVRIRLISDVPLGVFLSGGIDSSLVASIAAKYTNRLKTFSIGFEEKEFSEVEDAKKTAKHIGSEHYYEILSPKKAIELVPKLMNYLDEPFADPSFFPTFLLSEFTKKYVTVALGGDGGDELFAGYPTYFAHLVYRIYKLQPTFLKKMENYIVEKFIPPSYKYFSWEFKLKKFLSAATQTPIKRHLIWMSYINPVQLYELTGKNISLPDLNITDNLNDIMLLDFLTYLTDDIL
ncbi:MAG: asparagine synthase (glutamine-hydrolyzing), partial [bacterium]|nr:asparagine synthase (glutamine-hydrolyzing) [bacterium]